MRWGVCVLALGLSGCWDGFGEGNSESGEFNVPTRHVIVGAELDVELRSNGILGGVGKEPESVQVVSGDALGLGRVLSEGWTVVGLTEGEATFEFVVDEDEGVQTDRVTLRATEPETFAMNACFGPFLRGATGWVEYEFNDSERVEGFGAPVGTGFYPVELSEPGAARVLPHDRSVDQFDLEVAVNAPDSIVLSSTLPGDDNQLTVQTVPLSEIDVTIRKSSSTAGERALVAAAVMHEGSRICSVVEALQLESETPKVCEVLSLKSTFEELGHRDFTVELLREGSCRLSASWNGEALDVGPFSFSVHPQSDGDLSDLGDLDFD